jgi:hypothetical protein
MAPRYASDLCVREVHNDAGEWARDGFLRHGIEYTISKRTKSDRYLDFLPLINGRLVELLDLPRLVDQLCGLKRRRVSGGRDIVDCLPGACDDVANVACGALLMCAEVGETWRFGEGNDVRH